MPYRYAKKTKKVIKRKVKPYKRTIKRNPILDVKSYTYYHRCATSFIISQTAGGDATGAISFSIASLPQIATYQAMYDQYKLNKLYVTFRPMYTATSLASSASGALLVPLLYTAIDLDDATAVNLIALREYQKCMCHDDKKAFSMVFVPSAFDTLGGGGASFTYGNVQANKTWADVANTGLVYYGIKWVITAQTAASTYLQQWNVEVGMSISFRGVR